MGIFRGICVALCFAIVVATSNAQTVPGLHAVQVAGGITQPLFVTSPPGDTSRLFIVLRGGQVLILNLNGLTLNATPFLDISAILTGGNEQGLLGFAFDPSYASNGKFYINMSLPGLTTGTATTRIAQLQVSANPNVADVATMKTVIQFDEPQTGHNGGWMGFSPRPNDDHNLYIATGDGGSENDQGAGHLEPTGNAQSTATLLGKLLRIHVDPATATYTYPANNPFIGSGTALQEIWALGLRNPFRCSFDRLTGRMFVGDVGQNTREEIDAQEATNPGGGENFGWRLREGTIATPGAVGGPPPVGNVDPIYDYPHTTGKSVIGGYVYRGKQIPALRGTYVFADYLGPSGPIGDVNKIFTLNYNGGGSATNVQDVTLELYPVSGSINDPSSLGEDANGELYICDITKGNVARIELVTPNVKIDSITRDPTGSPVVVHGTGVPFKTHTIQATQSLSSPFINIGTATALGDGTFQFPDSANMNLRFYRAVYP